MSEITFAGVARQSDGLNTFLNEHFGIVGRRVGSDLVFREEDIASGFRRRPLVHIHHQLPLTPGQDPQTAAALCSLISDEARRFQPDPLPDDFRVPGAFGLLSDIDAVTVQLAIQTNNHLEADVAERVIPLMRDRLSAAFVTGVSVDVALQARLSLAKLGLLAARYDIADAASLVFERRALQGVLPVALDTLAYVDALTRYSPLAFTLVRRKEKN